MKIQGMDSEAARAAAKRIYQKVNFGGGALQSYEISSLLAETYDYLKIPFKPSSKDIKAYTQVLDVNRDGQVTLGDLESLAINFLCGPGVLGNQLRDSGVKKTKFQVQENYVPVNSSNYNNYQTVSNNYTSAEIKNVNESSNQVQASIQSNPQQQGAERRYNQQTINILTITGQIFEGHADQSFSITEPVVADLLSKTYETLGRKGYRPSEEDVKVWMKLCDGNGDGHVQYEQYEYFVIRSLERSGFQVY